MSAIFDDTAYEMSVKILPEVCTSGKIKISQLMMLHQQIGEKHLNVFKTSSEKMRNEQNLAFIFTKAAILIQRLPLENEEITVRTWCSELKGVRFTRNYQTFDKNGEVLTECKCEVTTIDLESRRIVRPSSINGLDDFLYNNILINNCESPRKLSASNEVSLVKTIKVTDENIDFNNHVNNTVYADMMVSILPKGRKEEPAKEVYINFVNEVLSGEMIELYALTNASEHVVHGKVGDKTVFLGEIKF
ncbi:MAG: hypothetical protein E7525_05415 [Ruminococcaceae bacterium]|nr:hypothetical protein [Oscillospiraceae bacterium]